jgi:rRNA maturation RNase YbeY
MSTLDIRNMTRQTTVKFPFAAAHKHILPTWEVSLAFVGTERAKAMNKQLRNKDYTPNVLSYQSGNKSGEIVICPLVAKKQAKKYDMTYTQFVGFLFIHGLLHLKGQQHGATMEKQERLLLKRFTS